MMLLYTCADSTLHYTWAHVRLQGHTVEVVCPDKGPGDVIKTAVHDFEGDQTYTEKRGHDFKLTAHFPTSAAGHEEYHALLIPGA